MTVVVMPVFVTDTEVRVNVYDNARGQNANPFLAVTLNFDKADIKSRTQQHDLIDRVSAAALAIYLETRDA